MNALARRPSETMTSERLQSYDKIIVMFSGGKDSLACVLHLLDIGVARERIELWHQDVDGGPDRERFMDWPVTEDYCAKVAAALGLVLHFQWKVGGFEGEMLRDNAPTAATSIEFRGARLQVGGRGPQGTRMKFPQVSPDLGKRWCSSYLKIDVGAKQLTNDPRFARGRFLVVTGERREESANRARYAELEPHRSTSQKRVVDQWRPVIDWSERAVWSIIERHRVNPHPAYRLGFGRVSCMACIFGNDDQWAAVKELSPAVFEKIATYEERFGVTIDREKRGVRARAARSKLNILQGSTDELRALSQSRTFDEPVFVDGWQLPAGAFKDCGGPT